MREKSTTFFEISSTTDQSPEWKPSSTKHRKGKGITPIRIPGSWWTLPILFAFLRIHSIYKPSFTACFFSQITPKNGDVVASSHQSLCYLSLTSSLQKRWPNKTSHTFPPENVCSQNDNQFLKDFRLSSQGHGCPVFPRRIGTHVLQPRVGCFMWHLSDADCPPKRWFCGKKYRRWEKLVNISTIRSRYVGDFILHDWSTNPPGPRTPPRNSRPSDQGLFTVGFP